jgi:hypothetical protein
MLGAIAIPACAGRKKMFVSFAVLALINVLFALTGRVNYMVHLLAFLYGFLYGMLISTQITQIFPQILADKFVHSRQKICGNLRKNLRYLRAKNVICVLKKNLFLLTIKTIFTMKNLTEEDYQNYLAKKAALAEAGYGTDYSSLSKSFIINLKFYLRAAYVWVRLRLNVKKRNASFEKAIAELKKGNIIIPDNIPSDNIYKQGFFLIKNKKDLEKWKKEYDVKEVNYAFNEAKIFPQLGGYIENNISVPYFIDTHDVLDTYTIVRT